MTKNGSTPNTKQAKHSHTTMFLQWCILWSPNRNEPSLNRVKVTEERELFPTAQPAAQLLCCRCCCWLQTSKTALLTTPQPTNFVCPATTTLLAPICTCQGDKIPGCASAADAAVAVSVPVAPPTQAYGHPSR